MSVDSAGFPQHFNHVLKESHSSNMGSHKRDGGRFAQQPGGPSVLVAVDFASDRILHRLDVQFFERS